MFFILSKIFWFFARPLNLLFLLALFAVLLGRLGWRRTARVSLASITLLFAAIGFTQLPDYIIHRLETAVAPAELPEDPAGIVILGGGVSANAQSDHVGYHLGESVDRLVKGLELKRLYPRARLIYTGGLATVSRTGRPEADAAMNVAEALYGDARGMEMESRAANTFQNAQFVAAMAGSDRARPWLLVTSGFHMPRSLAVFRKAGMNVVPVPTDYRADPIRFPWVTGETSYQFLKLSLAVKELVGLAAYRLTGRTETLFPR